VLALPPPFLGRTGPGSSNATRGTSHDHQGYQCTQSVRGFVKEIVPGPVLSEVDVETPAGIVTSVVTSRSLTELDLRVGSEVLALVKSTEVALAKL
jgi:molybdopterin-binding protein